MSLGIVSLSSRPIRKLAEQKSEKLRYTVFVCPTHRSKGQRSHGLRCSHHVPALHLPDSRSVHRSELYRGHRAPSIIETLFGWGRV